MRRGAARPGGADADQRNRAVHTLEPQVEPPRPLPRRFQLRADLRRQPVDRGPQRLRAQQRFGEIAARGARGGRDHRHDRLRRAAQRLIESGQHRGAAPPGQRAARQGHEIGDPRQTQPIEQRHRRRLQPQRRRRQRRKHGGRPARRHHPGRRRAEPGERPGRPRRVRHRGAGAKTRRAQATAEIGEQRRLPPARCAAPVMSIHSPSGGSAAASGA